MTHSKSSRAISSDKVLVYLGKTSLQKWQGQEQDAKVAEIVVNDEYDPERFYGDIAVLKLKHRLERTNFVRPVCLWNFDSDLKNIVDKLGSVPGWWKFFKFFLHKIQILFPGATTKTDWSAKTWASSECQSWLTRPASGQTATSSAKSHQTNRSALASETGQQFATVIVAEGWFLSRGSSSIFVGWFPSASLCKTLWNAIKIRMQFSQTPESTRIGFKITFDEKIDEIIDE